MNNYVYIVNNIVHEIIPEFVDIFPDAPIEERYSQDFLAQCIIVDESVEVKVNWVYDPETKMFSRPPYELRGLACYTLRTKQDGSPLLVWEGEELTVNEGWEKHASYEPESDEAILLNDEIEAAQDYIYTFYPDK